MLGGSLLRVIGGQWFISQKTRQIKRLPARVECQEIDDATFYLFNPDNSSGVPFMLQDDGRLVGNGDRTSSK